MQEEVYDTQTHSFFTSCVAI